MSESLGAQELVVETIATIGGLVGGEGSAMLPGGTAEATGGVGAKTVVAGEVLESGVAEPAAAKDQTAPPEASPGMVGPVVRSLSP